jgi:hypothetical protein
MPSNSAGCLRDDGALRRRGTDGLDREDSEEAKGEKPKGK